MTPASIQLPQRTLSYESLAEAFPDAEAGLKPFGDRVLVQIRTPKKKSKGGIILGNETTETELWNTQVARVVELGPVAFCNRDTLQPWPEGAWAKPGAFVRVPKYGGDRWFVPVNGGAEMALFVLFKDLELIGQITCDPLEVIAFI